MLGWLIQCLIVIKSILTPWNRAQMKWISVLWDSMATACEDEASYKKAYYRIKNYYRNNKPKIRRCKTDAARAEYTKRMQLLDSFIFQLEKELF